MASSTSSQNNFDLNVVPNAQPEVWHPSFQSQNGPITVNDSVMMSNITATAVAVGIINPRDEMLLADRTDAQAINDSLAFTIQCAAFVSNMGRRLHVRGREVRALSTQVSILKLLFKDSKRKN